MSGDYQKWWLSGPLTIKTIEVWNEQQLSSDALEEHLSICKVFGVPLS